MCYRLVVHFGLLWGAEANSLHRDIYQLPVAYYCWTAQPAPGEMSLSKPWLLLYLVTSTNMASIFTVQNVTIFSLPIEHNYTHYTPELIEEKVGSIVAVYLLTLQCSGSD